MVKKELLSDNQNYWFLKSKATSDIQTLLMQQPRVILVCTMKYVK